MLRIAFWALAITFLNSAYAVPGQDQQGFEYPYYLVDAYNPDNECWKGMGVDGSWPVPVIPEKWLVGPPPAEMSGVTLPTDYWVELRFRGIIINGPDNDVYLRELGQCGEQALVLLINTDGQEYPLGIATAMNTGLQAPTGISFDISGIPACLTPCAIRLVGLDMGGGSPGFDIGSAYARIDANCTDIASWPYPIDGARNTAVQTVLSWLPGCSADKHTVYFGDSANDVGDNAAPVNSPSQPQEFESYVPCEYELGKTYYWRIDEVNNTDVNDIRQGNVWKYMVTEDIVLDDFEFYNLTDNRLYDYWKEQGDRSAFIYLADYPVHKCFKSMLFSYYCDDFIYAEAVRSFEPPQDWASIGAKALELFFYGRQDNTLDGQFYLSLDDGSAGRFLPYTGDVNAIKEPAWHRWQIDLTTLTDVNLAHIESITIGFRNVPDKPERFNRGVVYFDDIAIHPSRCLQENRQTADLDGDCVVDFVDLEEMSHSWLQTSSSVYSVKEPNAPVARYEFDGNTNDSAGVTYGELRGSPHYVTGVHGQAISFDNRGDSVEIVGAADLFARINKAITITFWQYGANSSHRTDTVCCSNYIYGSGGPAIAVNLGCWKEAGKYNWDCGYPWSLNNRLSGKHRYEAEWSGRWNHWAFIKDSEAGEASEKGRMQIFLNGALYAERAGTDSPITGVTSFEIGSGWYGGYDGTLDDFRIYDYALSAEEAAYLATDGTGVFDNPIMSPADLNGDEQVDFLDFAVLSGTWLSDRLWP